MKINDGMLPRRSSKRMQFDRGFGCPKRSPRKNRQAQVDCRRIQCVNGVDPLKTGQGLVGVKLARHSDKMLREVRVNPPIPLGVGVRHCIAGDLRATKAQAIKFGGLRPQARFDIAQTLPPRQLREGEAAELVETGEMLDLVIAAIPRHAPPKRRQRRMIHQLRENILAVGHARSLQR